MEELLTPIQRTLSVSNSNTSQPESIQVLVRVRPLSEKENQIGNPTAVEIIGNCSLVVHSSDKKRTFQCSFDSVIGPEASQAEVYEIVKGCTASVLDGFNSTIFAYGQTGSGKTYSMYGPPLDYSHRDAFRHTEVMGLIPRAVNEIFELSKKKDVIGFTVYCSFVQIYNENLFDMLRDANMAAPLSIREDNKEIYVQGLSEYNVKSVTDTMQLLRVAEENRAIRETHMNQFSSRSHSIFQIFVEYKRTADDGGEVSLKAKFNLVDLAGSEKWNLRQELRDEHIAEMTNINLSLHTLGKCISSLAQQSREREKNAMRNALQSRSSLESSGSLESLKAENSSTNINSGTTKGTSVHVPYRESKLTRLLQDSLGGNARTFLIATISPAKENCEESISTLKFADRAKQVMVMAVVNETRPVDHALVKRLQQEVETLRALLRRVTEYGINLNKLNCGTVNLSSDHGSVVKLIEPIGASSTTENSLAVSPAIVASKKASPEKTPQQINLEESNNNFGGGVDYICSLERALNKEQTISQHLTKKIETLMKELEDLKFQNLQLLSANNHPILSPNARIATDNKSNLSKSNLQDFKLSISSEEVNDFCDYFRLVRNRNESLAEKIESIQKIMKKFFKFQLEEDQMKEQLSNIFLEFRDEKKFGLEKDSEKSQFVESFLQSLISQADKNKRSGRLSGSNPSFSVDIKSYSGCNSALVGGLEGQHLPNINNRSNFINENEANHDETIGNSSIVAQSNRKKTMRLGRKQSKSAGVLETSQKLAINSSAQTVEEYTTSAFHGSQDSFTKPSLDGAALGKSNGLVYRVRGAGSNISLDSVGSSGGWNGVSQLISQADEEAKEEEKILNELKDAKRKMKKQQKLQEWMKAKEDKARLEILAQEEERRTMLQAEQEREAKRKEYIKKQKMKLENYQLAVKSDAEKFKELIALGIDPASLI